MDKYVEELTVSTSYKTNYNEVEFYINPFALEFKVNDKLSLGAAAGVLYYDILTIKENDSHTDYHFKQLLFNLNNTYIHVKLYF